MRKDWKHCYFWTAFGLGDVDILQKELASVVTEVNICTWPKSGRRWRRTREGLLLMTWRLLPFRHPEQPRVSLVPYRTQDHTRKGILERVVHTSQHETLWSHRSLWESHLIGKERASSGVCGTWLILTADNWSKGSLNQASWSSVMWFPSHKLWRNLSYHFYLWQCLMSERGEGLLRGWGI